jgi:hypothetical protein
MPVRSLRRPACLAAEALAALNGFFDGAAALLADEAKPAPTISSRP